MREVVGGRGRCHQSREAGKSLGAILVAEGLLAAIPEFQCLVQELEALPMPSPVGRGCLSWRCGRARPDTWLRLS